MPDAFDLELNTSEVVFALNRLKREQIPFAQSLALNWTLKDAQAEVREQLPRRFTIRRPWLPRGVVVKPSSKRQLWGTITQRDPFMSRQEFGGQKTPQGKAIAVPVGALARLAKTKVLSKGKRPAAQMRKKNAFVPVAHCVSLAMLDNFTYPADLFPTSRFYREDLSGPPLELITMPDGSPGVEVFDDLPEPVPARLEQLTIEKTILN